MKSRADNESTNQRGQYPRNFLDSVLLRLTPKPNTKRQRALVLLQTLASHFQAATLATGPTRPAIIRLGGPETMVEVCDIVGKSPALLVQPDLLIAIVDVVRAAASTMEIRYRREAGFGEGFMDKAKLNRMTLPKEFRFLICVTATSKEWLRRNSTCWRDFAAAVPPAQGCSPRSEECGDDVAVIPAQAGIRCGSTSRIPAGGPSRSDIAIVPAQAGIGAAARSRAGESGATAAFPQAGIRCMAAKPAADSRLRKESGQHWPALKGRNILTLATRKSLMGHCAVNADEIHRTPRDGGFCAIASASRSVMPKCR